MYARRVTVDADGTVSIDMRDTGFGSRTDASAGWFSYKRVGTLRNGVHVLETWENGGGSGVFTSVLFVTFAIDDDLGVTSRNELERRRRLLMKRVGEVGIGDRYLGTVTVRDDTVEVSADNHNITTKLVFRIP